MSDEKPPGGSGDKLSISAPFEDAIRAALQVKPAVKPKRKPRAKRSESNPESRDA
jgi:hypothetical protein